MYIFIHKQVLYVQSTPDNSNHQGKEKIIGVTGSWSYQELRDVRVKEGSCYQDSTVLSYWPHLGP